LRSPLPRSLKAKRAAMEKALAAYQSAADYGVAEVTTAATFATAELYRRLASDLMASEKPANLTADELEQYELLLEEQAYPFEERAIELHETNAGRAADGLYDQSVQDSFAALAELKPARYARQELPAAPTTAEEPLAGALAAAEAGDWQAAESGFTRVLEAGAGPAGLTGLGLAYRHTGRFALAEQAYRSALAADPAYGPAMLNLAVLLDLYLQQPAAALELYQGYQATLTEPDARVGGWIREVEIRAGRGGERAGVGP
jgi:tetratricopeptide (TPR) repeat protein